MDDEAQARCAKCGSLLAGQETRELAGASFCAACHDSFYHYRLPLWVKVFGLLVLAAVVAGSLVNYPYFKAYAELKASSRAYNDGDLEKALALAESARGRARLDDSVGAYADYLRAFLSYDDSQRAEAREAVQEYLLYKPEDALAGYFYYSMALADAFDAGKYSEMREHALKILEYGPDNPIFLLSCASASACLYATEGGQEWLDEAESYIEKAEPLVSAEGRAEFEEYLERIRYRLDKRLVIDTDEYERRKAEGRL
jgi:tetratricopeptide (TPR) repeat protein